MTGIDNILHPVGDTIITLWVQITNHPFDYNKVTRRESLQDIIYTYYPKLLVRMGSLNISDDKVYHSMRQMVLGREYAQSNGLVKSCIGRHAFYITGSTFIQLI